MRLGFLVILMVIASDARPVAQPAGIQRLAWLQGCWEVVLAYEAHPSGQPAAVFLSRAVSDSSVLFENLQHDFPQRVGYQRDGPDSLLAWIEGMQNGQSRRIDFPYRRAACSGTGH